MNSSIFQTIPLEEQQVIFISPVIDQFNLSYDAFQSIWDMHPEQYHTLKIHGKEVLTPRWQQAYGKNYRYTGAKNNALPIPDELKPFLTWCQTEY